MLLKEPESFLTRSRIMVCGAVAASIVAGAAAALGAAVVSNFASQSEVVQFIDLSDRPTFDTVLGNGKTQTLKMVQYGEIADLSKGLGFYLEGKKVADVARQGLGLSPHTLQGSAIILDAGRFATDENVCLVQYKPNQPPHSRWQTLHFRRRRPCRSRQGL